MSIPDLTAIEAEISGRWRRSGTVAAALSQRSGGPLWSCYLEPTVAAGVPGTQLLKSLTVNDVYLRVKTMQGYQVARWRGLNCHGLDIELAVCAELGLSTGQADIEGYGVESFTRRCRESAARHTAAFGALADRIGCQGEPSGTYATMDVGYIESVWWSLKQAFDAGLLVADYRTNPYCPLCQTILAGHELRGPGVFRPVAGTDLVVRLRLAGLPAGASRQLRDAELLAWTAAPWQLAANTGIAVGKDETLAIARKAGQDDRVVLAESRFARILGEGWHIAARITGSELAGATYRPVFPAGQPELAVTGSSQRLASGTGLVLLTPAYGLAGERADVMSGLADPLGPDGRFGPDVPALRGVFFADADPIIARHLADRGQLFASRSSQRRQAHCWRCGTPLLTRATRSWYLRTSAISELMAAEADRILWPPNHDAGSPLAGSHLPRTDWAVSRPRYWGTPLPIWECERGHPTCVSSLAELSELAGQDLLSIDPHRPEVDGIEISCRVCSRPARRVPDVLDAGYDAGAMPFAQFGAPQRGGAAFAASFPARLAADSAQHASSWFYAMLVIGIVAQGQAPFQAGLRHGGVSDDRGAPMGSGQGNLTEPGPLIERNGVDAVRWYFAATSGRQRAVTATDAAISTVAGRVLASYWHSVRCYGWYAGEYPAGQMAAVPAAASRPVLDRWLLSELQLLISDVTSALETFRPDAATSRLAGFIRDLSRWYLRGAKRRWRDAGPTGPADGCPAAVATLRECLEVLSRLMAPITPVLSDYVWDLVRAPDAPESVHLAGWPRPNGQLIDEPLNAQMVRIRRIVRAGRAARARARIEVRQPLAAALITGVDGIPFSQELLTLVTEELNVKHLESMQPLGDLAGELARQPDGWTVGTCGGITIALDLALSPELRREGLARWAIRIVNDARRRASLKPLDPIELRWAATEPDHATALRDHGAAISQAVRARNCAPVAHERPSSDNYLKVTTTRGITFWLKPT